MSFLYVVSFIQLHLIYFNKAIELIIFSTGQKINDSTESFKARE